jgi:hypothetical protein
VQAGADRKITRSKTAVVENLRSTQSRPMQAPELLNSCIDCFLFFGFLGTGWNP